MKISEIVHELALLAPPAYQESYDNCGLLTGNAQWNCTGALCTLDVTEAVVQEAINNHINLIIAHHPIIFSGLKQITGKNYIEQTIIAAIKNDIAIYAIHTNLDNVLHGVNHKIANLLGLVNQQILQPKTGLLVKLFTYVPLAHAEAVKKALFNVGAGNIGNYSHCSFSTDGLGTFKAAPNAHPFVGEIGVTHAEKEVKLEVVFPAHQQAAVVAALKAAHPYEEVAYDTIALTNPHQQVGSGLIGHLPAPISETDFLQQLKTVFGLQVVRHTPLRNKIVSTVALCGGSGSFLIKQAIAAKADVYVTGDVKYHEFFDAENKLVIADIGHWESEQFTPYIIIDFLRIKFPTFAVLKSKVNTNPLRYF